MALTDEELKQQQFNVATNSQFINTRVEQGKINKQQAATITYNKQQLTNPYAVAADANNIEAGDPSIFETAGQSVAAVGASVISSFWNTGVALGNAFGADWDEVSTGDMLRDAGLSGSADFYDRHSTGVDAVGFAVGALIPGIGGAKLLRLAQKGMASSNIRLVAGLGKLAKSDDEIKAAVQSIASGSVKQVWSRDSARLVAKAAGQGALEGVAGSWLTLATMNQAPTLNDTNLGYFGAFGKNFTFDTMLGAGLGGTIGAGVGTFKLWGGGRRALNAIRGTEAEELQNIKAPSSIVTVGTDGKNVVTLTSGDRMGFHADDYLNTTNKINELEQANLEGTISATDKNVRLPALQQRKLKVSNELRKQMKGLSSDADIQQYLQDTYAGTDEGIAQVKDMFTGAINVRPAMDGLGSFRPASLDIAELAENSGRIAADSVIPEGNLANYLYADDVFMRNVSDWHARYNDLAAGGGDDFLTGLIASDAKVFGNTSGTGPINLRRAVKDMQSISREVNPERWKIVDSFQSKYKGMTADKLDKLSDIDKSKFRMELDEVMRATNLADVFGDVHGALFTEGLGKTVAKQYPRTVQYLNDNQLTGKYLKNNFAIIDTASNTVYHQNILPTVADFGKPAIKSTISGNVVNFGAYSVPVKPGLFNLTDMSNFKSASTGGLGTKETSALLKKYDEYAIRQNATYVGAQLDKRFITSIEKENGKTIIGAEDLPYLDAALSSKANKFFVENAGELDRDGLNKYVRDLKARKIEELHNANINLESSWSTQHLARIFNTDDSFVELSSYRGSLDTGKHTIQNLAEGKPRFLKVKYATDFDKTNPEITSRWQSITQANKNYATTNSLDVLGNLDQTLANALADVDELMPSVKTLTTDTGTGYFAAANGAFNSYESRAQMIGQLVNTAHHRVAQSIQSNMLPHSQAIMKNELARNEIGVVVAKARSGKYVSAEGLDDLVNQIAPAMQSLSDPSTVARFTNKLATLVSAVKNAATKGENGVFINADNMRVVTNLRDSIANGAAKDANQMAKLFDAAAERFNNSLDDTFSIKTKEVGDFVKQHMDINKRYVGMRTQINSATGKVTRWNPDELYFGAPDIKGKSIAFIESPRTPSGERARHMIIANTPEERNAQIAIIERDYADKGYKVYTDPQAADFKESLAKWEGGEWNNTPEFSADLQSKGVANNFFPRSDGYDATSVVNDTIKRHTQLIRDSVQTRFAEDFASLRGMEEAWDTMYGKPTRGMRNAYLEDNPARKIRQLALDLPQDSSKVASYVNNFIENGADWVDQQLKNAFSGGKKMTDVDVQRINAVMKDAGMNSAYANAAELMLANSDIPQHTTRKFVATANAFVSLGMHRLETMMSLINAVGNTVLSTPLIATTIRNLPDDIRMANFGVNSGVGVELSVPKFMAQSMQAVMKDNKALFEKYTAMGLPVTHSRIYSQMMDTLVTEGKIDSTYLLNKINAMGDFAGKYNMSNALTGFNRLLYAHMGERLANMSGATEGLAKSSFINTFINKVEGTMVSSQRPKFFQGLIGQAMGLFQSYNLHLMQQLTSNILDGNARASVQALAMNATLFGGQSLPGWDELNHVIASRNRDGFGADTYLNDAFGNDIGEWLTYGSLSNMLHMGVFTRGRIELGFGLTGSLADRIPAVSILQNTLSGASNMMTNIAQNGLSVTGLLEGMNTMQWNRPLAELAQRALGYTPTKYGDIISYSQKSENMFATGWSIFGAALGAKDLDAAIANSQYYATKQRKAIVQDRLNDLGAKVKKATHNDGVLSQEDVEEFASKYVEKGGDLKNFQRWIISTSVRGQVAQVENLRKGINTAAGRQAQALMGGAAPNLFDNTEDDE